MQHSFDLKSSTSIDEIVKALDGGGIGFLAFVDEQNKLVGVVTDGDLRRGILSKDLSVNSVINYDPMYMLSTETQESIVSKLKHVHRRHMPLVDDFGELVSVFSLDDIDFVSKKNVVVIMAGGLGSRLGELTKVTPKPMLVVGDRPMLQHLVEQFRDQGFYKFIFCLNYKKEVIMDFFDDGSRLGVNIQYVIEEEKLGTAGALSLIDGDILSEPFFVVNADVLANLDFGKVLENHMNTESLGTMCVRNYSIEVPYGVIKSEAGGRIESIEEKPQLKFDINAGIYVLNPKLLELIPKRQFYDMPSLFERLIEDNKKATIFRLEDYWVDIGKVEDLKKANDDLTIK